MMIFGVFAACLLGCGRGDEASVEESTSSTTIIRTGAEVLVDNGFAPLPGWRIGLIANHTSRVGGDHLADVLHGAPGVELVALFGPEHGIRGNADAGAGITDTVDASLGIPVYSLYGERRSPDPAVLRSLDVVIFDIQDVGARFYTYISTMGLAMEAAAVEGVAFIVLDRPNPLGGNYVSGFVREPGFRSFVGHYPIPVAHGMTVGEIATMAVGERWGSGLEALDLSVVKMDGWRRELQWPDLGRDWVATSPNIPDFETALVYPGMCFVEGTLASEGRGTRHPFLTIGAPWLDSVRLSQRLTGDRAPGLRALPISFTPLSIPGMATHPKLMDQALRGVQFEVVDRRAVRPVETGVHLLHELVHAYADSAGNREGFFRARGIDRLAGTGRLREMLSVGSTPEEIIASWREEVAAFVSLRERYLLYD